MFGVRSGYTEKHCESKGGRKKEEELNPDTKKKI
jgi:hypothetical protein